MVWDSILPPYAGGTNKTILSSYFSNGSDGNVVITTNTASAANTGNNFIGNYTSLTVNASTTFTLNASGYAILYVSGNCTVNGTITIASGASAIVSKAMYVERNLQNALSPGSNYEVGLFTNATCPAVGSAGGASVPGNGGGISGSAGSAGSAGGTGGGGSGATSGNGTSGSTGAGGTGTGLSGGAGSVAVRIGTGS